MTEKTGKNAVKMREEKRTREIQKAIKLLGWVSVGERVQTPEDKAIFDKLGQEYREERRASEDRILKSHHIKL